MEVARGTYRYQRDGELQDIREPWKLIRDANGLQLSGQRLVGGKLVLDVAAHYSGLHCDEMRIDWQPGDPATARRLSYLLHDDRLQWTDEGKTQSMPLPAGSLMFPLLRAATGPLLTALGAKVCAVVVPCLHDPADHSAFLQPLLSQRHATQVDGDHYRYFGGEYGNAGCDCWLNADGLLQRYRWSSTGGDWAADLDDYAATQKFNLL